MIINSAEHVNSATIIGGSGFIGTRLVKRLLDSRTLTPQILDKSPSETYPELIHFCDVRSIEQLRSTIVDRSLIVNLAAEHRDDVHPLYLYDDVNIGGAKNICAVASEKEVRTIVFTSTVAVYGFAKECVDESGEIAPFNRYGLTKHEAEKIYIAWQAEDPNNRTLVIIRPTVVFGEQNRGNVYNLLRQVARGLFVMVGSGENRKSMAYVENLAAFIEHSMNFKPGVHLYNYIDKPDFSMNELVAHISRVIGRSRGFRLRIPLWIGLLVGKCFDFVAMLTGKRFSISSIRIKKFSTNSVYESAVPQTGFVRPVPLETALEQTIRYEFLEHHSEDNVFHSE